MLDWYCETFKCKMSKETCLQRRQESKNNYSVQGMIFRDSGCLKCNQFGDIEMEEIIPEDAQVCSLCGVLKNLQRDFRPNRKHPSKKIKICRQCEVDPPIKKRHVPVLKDINLEKKSKIISIDFTNYPGILHHIEQLSLREFRTIDKQILYMINPKNKE